LFLTTTAYYIKYYWYKETQNPQVQAKTSRCTYVQPFVSIGICKYKFDMDARNAIRAEYGI